MGAGCVVWAWGKGRLSPSGEGGKADVLKRLSDAPGAGDFAVSGQMLDSEKKHRLKPLGARIAQGFPEEVDDRQGFLVSFGRLHCAFRVWVLGQGVQDVDSVLAVATGHSHDLIQKTGFFFTGFGFGTTIAHTEHIFAATF